MNIQKFTQKSIEAVQDCEKIAVEYGNQEIEQEHLLYALMTIEDSTRRFLCIGRAPLPLCHEEAEQGCQRDTLTFWHRQEQIPAGSG